MRTLICALLALVIIGIIVYIRLWELHQPVIILPKTTIRSISPYYYNGGDLHWAIHGYRVYVNEDERPIDFPAKRWNDSVKVGIRATLEVRKSFFRNELDGISIIANHDE